jgi:hypothetical protein
VTNLPPCPRCDRPIHDQAYICGPCGSRLAKDLAAVVAIAGEAWTTIARQAANGAGSGRSAEKPLPFSWEAADATDSASNVLITWARHIAEERGIPWMPPPSVQGPLCANRACRGCASIAASRRRLHPMSWIARWLREQLDWLRHRREATEAFDELHDACRLLVRTVDRPPVRWYAGPCDGCTLDLYAMPGAAKVRCRECGTDHDAEARKMWLLECAEDLLAHAALVAKALTALGYPVAEATVRSYAHRGRILEKGRDEQARALYRVGDVLELVRDNERRRERVA